MSTFTKGPIHTAGTWRLLADLPLRIDGYTLAPLALPLCDESVHRTTVVRLHGDGEQGVGEDVTPNTRDQLAFQAWREVLPIAGNWTLASFSARLGSLDLFPTPPIHPRLRSCRRWAFESAGLDLALRQAGRSLADVLGVAPQPVSFVDSIRLTSPPTADPVLQRLAVNPSLRFTLQPTREWDDELIATLLDTGSVATLDLNGQYPAGAPSAQPGDTRLYARLFEAFDQAWIEDPAITPNTEPMIAAHRQRIVWDLPILTVADIAALPLAPGAVNLKPARIGRLQSVLDIYEHCTRNRIPTHGSGLFELGAGRGQLQYLAALLHPDAPNDVAPVEYHNAVLPPRPPVSPLTVTPSPTGFRLCDD